MSDRQQANQGHQEHGAEGLGQRRVGEAGPGPRQEHPFPSSAGGPGPGSGDAAVTDSEDQSAGRGRPAGDLPEVPEDST